MNLEVRLSVCWLVCKNFLEKQEVTLPLSYRGPRSSWFESFSDEIFECLNVKVEASEDANYSDICEKRFTKADDMKTHISNEHSNNDSRIFCPECEFVAKNQNALRLTVWLNPILLPTYLLLHTQHLDNRVFSQLCSFCILFVQKLQAHFWLFRILKLDQ